MFFFRSGLIASTQLLMRGICKLSDLAKDPCLRVEIMTFVSAGLPQLAVKDLRCNIGHVLVKFALITF